MLAHSNRGFLLHNISRWAGSFCRRTMGQVYYWSWKRDRERQLSLIKNIIIQVVLGNKNVDYSQLTSRDIESLLSHTQSLFNHVYYFTQDLSYPPGRSHRGAAVNTVDIREKRKDFLRELANTACNWVYSNSRYKEIIKRELEKREGDELNAISQSAIPGGFLSPLMEGVSYPLFRKVFITPGNLRLYKLKVSDMLAGCPRKHRSQPRL